MRLSAPTRCLLALCAARAAAQGLPATAPTAANTVAPISATATAPNSVTRGHRAGVQYANGKLTVDAYNSSLNGTLREISRVTGMKITGGVGEDRVFGHYGPATPETVLKTLLDGTNTNILIRQNDDGSPAELVLSGRNGAATPPNPTAAGYDDPPEEAPAARIAALPQPPARPAGTPLPPIGYPGQVQGQLPTQSNPQASSNPQAQPPTTANTPQQNPQPANNVLGNPANVTPTVSQLPTSQSVSIDSVPTPSTTSSTSQGIVDAPNPPPAGTMNPVTNAPGTITTPDSPTTGTPTTTSTPTPTGERTPEQIFQQLQQLRQQQPAPPPQ